MPESAEQLVCAGATWDMRRDALRALHVAAGRDTAKPSNSLARSHDSSRTAVPTTTSLNGRRLQRAVIAF